MKVYREYFAVDFDTYTEIFSTFPDISEKFLTFSTSINKLLHFSHLFYPRDMDFVIISIDCRGYFSQSTGICGYPVTFHLIFEVFRSSRAAGAAFMHFIISLVLVNKIFRISTWQEAQSCRLFATGHS